MQRFGVGEQVLVCKFMGEKYAPPKVAVVVSTFPNNMTGHLFDYLVETGSHRYRVRDTWLVPFTVTIQEEPEYADLV